MIRDPIRCEREGERRPKVLSRPKGETNTILLHSAIDQEKVLLQDSPLTVTLVTVTQ